MAQETKVGENTTMGKLLAFILMLEDGSETCPSYVYSDDPLLPLPEDPSRINVQENPFYKEILEKAGKIKNYRFEYLTWSEIFERGYGEKPPL